MIEKVNLKDKTVCFYDSGLFIEQAVTVSKDFGRTMYFSEYRSAFPSKKGIMIGEGMEGVERIDNIWDHLDEIDLFCFPDCYFGGIQNHLRSLGKRVWGAGDGDELELCRDDAKKHFKSLGLEVKPYKVIIGLDKLKTYLKKVENKYIKISSFRGDAETWHHEKYNLSIPMLDKWENTLGPMKDDYEFIVEDAIDGEDVVEAGSDVFTVDGKYPKQIISGFEIKDLGYVGCVMDYDKVSPLVTDFNDKISETLKEYKYRMFMSTEIRVGKDKVPYMIDFCGRCPSPPNELYQTMIENLAEIMWHGAEGTLIEPIYKAKYGIEVLIHSDWASENWQAIYFPEKIREWVKLRNACKIGDTYYIVPQNDGLPEIGAVVAIGDSIEECIKKVKEYADQVEGYRLDIKTGSIEDMKEVIEKSKKLGIIFK